MSNPLILVVEDNPSDVYILRRALLDQDEHINLQVVCDGEQAIQFLRTHRNDSPELQPCLIALDLHLPKQDGLEVLHFIREDPALNHIQVVVITGAASPREEAELHNYGLVYRQKPESPLEFDNLAADLVALCKSSQVLMQSGAY